MTACPLKHFLSSLATWRGGPRPSPKAPEVMAAAPPPPQGDTPRQRAEKAQDTELAAYLENRQHYQMVQREDQETAV